MTKHQSVCQVVYILARAREVKVLLLRCQISIPLESLLEEVLNGLHIVICRPLNLFHPLSVLQREVCEDFVHECFLLPDPVNSGCVLSDNALVEESLEPVELDVDAEPDKSELAEVGPECVAAASIATINGADCCEWRDLVDRGSRRCAEAGKGRLLQDGGTWANRVKQPLVVVQIFAQSKEHSFLVYNH